MNAQEWAIVCAVGGAALEVIRRLSQALRRERAENRRIPGVVDKLHRRHERDLRLQLGIPPSIEPPDDSPPTERTTPAAASRSGSKSLPKPD